MAPLLVLRDPGAAPRGLLLPEEAAARARPLRSWSSEQVERVRHLVEEAHAGWRSAWGLKAGGPATASAGCAAAHEIGAGARESWCSLERAEGVWWQIAGTPTRGPQESGRALCELSLDVFGEACGDPGSGAIARELLARAWRDLEERLGKALALASASGEHGQPPRALFYGWSGALSFTIPWWTTQLRLLVSGDVLERLLHPAGRPTAPAAPRAGLVPLARAVHGRTLRVRVQLRSFDLEVASLAMLRVGDVLRTTHGIEDALDVEVLGPDDDAAARWAAFLGQVGPRRAVELVAPPRGTR